MEMGKEMRECLEKNEFGIISTVDKGIVRSRAMHYAFDDDSNFYLATIKGDPKVNQIVNNNSISLLSIVDDKGFFEAKEVEVIGSAEILNSENDREKAFALLEKRSPVVANMKQGGALSMLHAIRIKPKAIKYRFVPDIMRGVGPAVVEFDRAEQQKNFYFTWSAFKDGLANWFTELRLPFLTATLIPVLLGTLIAWARTNSFDLSYLVLTLLGVAFLHLGTNVANDYFDHKSGNDEANTEFVRPFSGGSRMIQKGLLKPAHVLTASLVFFALGSLIGFYLTWTRGIEVLILGMIGVFSGYFYCAPPFRLVNHGLGELFIGANFGILTVLGSYFVQTGHFALEPILASIPIALLIIAVVWINEFPDFNADKSVGKNNLVVRFGKKVSADVYSAMMWLVFISTGVFVVSGKISPFALLIFLLIPRAARAIRVARLNYSNTLLLVPANADTIMSHLFGGLLISLAYILQKIFIG